MLRATSRPFVSAPQGTDPNAPNAPPRAGAAFSDTVLAARPARATTGVAMSAASADAAETPRDLAETLRALPLGIQGIWLGLLCILLLVGSAAALRSLFSSAPDAKPAPTATASATGATIRASATSISAAPPIAAEPTATATSGSLSIGAAGPPPSGAGGALAIRDRLASHVRLRKFGPFIDDLNRLVDIEPAAIDRADVRKMIADTTVYAMAPGPGGGVSQEADRLFAFLTDRAGSAGPDILFDLVTTRGGTRAASRAEALLDRKDIHAKGTTPFKIANELRAAASCQDRVKLYPRVKAEGDKRVLQFLFQMARCGKGPTDCCMGNEQSYKDVVQAITSKK
jgi:hypothetical protein